MKELLDLAVDVQQVPAPTFEEEARGDFLMDLFRAEKLDEISRDEAGNVYGCYRGEGVAPPLVICAHLDTVFPLETDLRLVRDLKRVAGPGIGDNSLAVAALVVLARKLRKSEIHLPGDLWLVGTTGEEGLGNLRGMRAVVDRFEDSPLAYLALEGMAFGYIYHRALGVRRYRVRAETQGGHSWGHYGRPSAIHELADLITKLTALQLSSKPRTTLNVGTIRGGTSVNTIAAEASFDLDMRSETPEGLAVLVEEVNALLMAATKPNVRVVSEVIGDRPAGQISASHPLVRLAEEAIRKQQRAPKLTIGSTDANIPLSRGYPAICVGITTGEGAHTLEEFVHTAPVEAGMAQLLYLVENLWERL